MVRGNKRLSIAQTTDAVSRALSNVGMMLPPNQAKQVAANAVTAVLNASSAAATAAAALTAPRRRGRPTNNQRDERAAASSKASATTRPTNTVPSNRGKASNSTVGKMSKRTNAELHAELNELREQVALLQRKVEALTSARPALTTNQNLRTVNSAVNDVRERERRLKNVVIRGIVDGDTRDHDEEQVRAFLQAVCPNLDTDAVQKVHRLRHAKQNNPSTDSSKRTPVPSVLVMLNDTETQRKVLKAARHHNSNKFKGVFAHEDRTPAQQMQYAECAKLARNKNEKLNEQRALDQPFRYVVRGDRVRCIDTHQSREREQSVYVTEQQIKQHLDSLKRLNDGISRDSVATRVSTYPQLPSTSTSQTTTGESIEA